MWLQTATALNLWPNGIRLTGKLCLDLMNDSSNQGKGQFLSAVPVPKPDHTEL